MQSRHNGIKHGESKNGELKRKWDGQTMPLLRGQERPYTAFHRYVERGAMYHARWERW